MHTLSDDELRRKPQVVLDDAKRGESALVTVDGEPVMLALPLGPVSGNSTERLELAVSLYERDLLSLGLATKVAGLSYSRMVDELSRRRIPVVRYDVDDLERELAYVRTLAGGR